MTSAEDWYIEERKTQKDAASNLVAEFVGNEFGYKRWIIRHPRGFVVDVCKEGPLDITVLHCSDCNYITTLRPCTDDGERNARKNIRICSERVVDLMAWLIAEGTASRKFSQECPKCHPWERSGYNEIMNLSVFKRIFQEEIERFLNQKMPAV